MDGSRCWSAVLLAGLAWLSPLAAPTPSATAERLGAARALDGIEVRGGPVWERSLLHHDVTLVVEVWNAGHEAVGPFEIETVPYPAVPDVERTLSGLRLAPAERTRRTVVIRPSRPGRTELFVRLRCGLTGAFRLAAIGAIEVRDVATDVVRRTATPDGAARAVARAAPDGAAKRHQLG